MNLNSKEESYILKLLKSSIHNPDYEFEIILKESDYKDISSEIFKHILRILKKNIQFTFVLNEPVLDIYIKSIEGIRISIIGKENIKIYCKEESINNIPEDKIIYMKKSSSFDSLGNKLIPLTVDNYNIKFKSKNEVYLKKDNEVIINMLEDWKNLLKGFRYKYRHSFIDKEHLFSIDMTVVKSSNDNEYVKRLNSINLFKSIENYELELEYIGKDIKLNPKNVYKKMMDYLLLLLKNINKTSYLLSKTFKNILFKKYLCLLMNKDLTDIEINKIKKSREFMNSHGGIGPKVVSLSMNNLLFPKNDNSISICVDYTVTEKTDGERQFLFVSDDGSCYLLDNVNEFRDINIKLPTLKNCIFDGEYLKKNKKNENINHYFAFDCYFFNGIDVRDLPLITANNKGIKLDCRFFKLKSLTVDVSQLPSIKFKIFKKEYKHGNVNVPGMDIFHKNNEVWKKVKSNDYEYNIDGLIFTPIKSQVGGKYNSSNKFYSGRSWNELLKWKPSHENTIDFLVSIQKIDGEDKIGYINVNGEVKTYKTLLLKVGNNLNKRIINPYDLLYVDNNINIEEKDKNVYGAQEFIPDEPYDPQAYIANVFVEKINNVDEIVPLKRNGFIKDNMIVEMSYEKDNEHGWRWKPRNIRNDKTEKLLKYGNEFGNNYKTALSIWKSYYNPITEVMILKGSDIPKDSIETNSVYYHIDVRERSNSPLISLRDFHNKYVKNKLYSAISNLFQNPSLLELACGKGGDLHKILNNNFNFVVGIDLYEDNIINSENGAIKRYLEEKKIRINRDLHVPNIFYLQGDCGKNIKNGDFTDLQYFKNIFKILWYGDKSIQLDKTIMPETYSLASSGFNIISCQFAIHYLFRDEFLLDTFINNIQENLNAGGYFIGTCFDGKTIFNRLKKTKKNSKIEAIVDNIPLWSITKKYDNEDFKDDKSSLGYEINVFFSTIGGAQNEYLVNFDYFVKKMEEKNLYLLDNATCNQLNLPYGRNDRSSDLFDKMYKDMHLELTSGKIEKRECGQAIFLEKVSEIQEYSFFNRWFIFQKK